MQSHHEEMLQLLVNNPIKSAIILFATVFTVKKLYSFLRTNLSSKVKRRCLRGKVVLITGATSGLGLELTRIFINNGCKVIMVSRRIKELLKVKEELIRSNTNDIFEPQLLQLDLNSLESISSKAKEALKFYGEIDILVNNAGVSFRGFAADTSLEVHKRIMDTNYFGQIALTKEILGSMLERKTGDIVVINSVQGKIAIPQRSAYTASKHALTAFFDSLRAEVANEGVNVCVVYPGYIKTNLSRNALTEDGSAYEIMDETTASGMEASLVAKRIFDSVLKSEKELTMATFSMKAAIILRSILPDIYFEIMSKRVKKPFKLR